MNGKIFGIVVGATGLGALVLIALSFTYQPNVPPAEGKLLLRGGVAEAAGAPLFECHKSSRGNDKGQCGGTPPPTPEPTPTETPTPTPTSTPQPSGNSCPLGDTCYDIAWYCCQAADPFFYDITLDPINRSVTNGEFYDPDGVMTWETADAIQGISHSVTFRDAQGNALPVGTYTNAVARPGLRR